MDEECFHERAGSRLTKGKRPTEVRKMDEGETDQLLHAHLDAINVASSGFSCTFFPPGTPARSRQISSSPVVVVVPCVPNKPISNNGAVNSGVNPALFAA